MILLLLLMILGCSKTVVLNQQDMEKDSADTTVVNKMTKELTTLPQDTARVPMNFNPTVEDWKEKDIQITL